MSELISPLVLTFNEEPNLQRTLEALRWARRVVVLDSGSTDRTLEIACSFANVSLEHRPFDSFAAQFSAGANACHTDWVLALDADHVLTPELSDELSQWTPSSDTEAYFARFRYCVAGSPLRASLYPPRIVLFNRRTCQYVQEGHHQLIQHPGSARFLRGEIRHDDRKPLTRWLQDQQRYAWQEAERLAGASPHVLSWADRCRRVIVLAPALVFLGTLLGKAVILDGWRGWFYTCQRTVFEIFLSLRLVEARWAKNK